MKKLALMAAAVATLATASAANESNKFTGFYLGAQLGYGTSKTSISGSTAGASFDLGGSGVLGGLHVGYTKQFNKNFALGLEAYGNLSGTNGSIKGGTQTSNFKRNNAFGLKLKPGFVMGNAFMYAVLGVESAKHTASETDSATPASNYSTSKRLTAFVPGLGVSFMATDHVMVGLEATHSIYNSVTGSNAAGTNKDSFKPRTTDFAVRLSYKW